MKQIDLKAGFLRLMIATIAASGSVLTACSAPTAPNPNSMTHASLNARSPRPRAFLLLLLPVLLLVPLKVLAHAGHSDHEFEAGGSAGTPASIQVDRVTGDRLGIRVELMARQRFALGIKATGQIEMLPNQQVRVTAPLTGTVVKLLAKPGDLVERGQELAVLTSPDLAELKTTALDRQTEAQGGIQTAEADLRLAKRNYDRQVQIANTTVEKAKTELKLAQERHNRNQELLAQGAISSRTVLESEVQLSVAKAELTEASSRMPVSEAAAQLEKAQSALQVAQSKLRLSDDGYQTRLRQLDVRPNQDGLVAVAAPISGTISDQTITPGESVNEAGVPLMTIVNGNGVWATANVYEKDLPKVSQGQRVRVRVTGIKGTFEGKISYIGAAIRSEARVVPVRAELNNLEGLLKPGMFAELEIVTGQTSKMVLSVPTAAIIHVGGRSLVYVKNGQNYEPVEVQLGRVDGDRTEITSGLFEGDRAVVQGAPMLYAQSLRGGNPNADKTQAGNLEQADSVKSFMLPGWAIIGGGAAIVISTFFAGIGWAKYRHRKVLAVMIEQSPPGSLNTPSNGAGQAEKNTEPTIDPTQIPH
jgi:membrane fusion protein, heavy metal efflux system